MGLKYGEWGREKYGTTRTKVDALEVGGRFVFPLPIYSRVPSGFPKRIQCAFSGKPWH